MALIFDGIKCPLCKEVLNIREPFFSSFAFDRPLSDAGMHWDCFFAMKDHEFFLDRMFQLETESTRANRYWSLIAADAESLVATNDLVVRVTIRCSAFTRDLDVAEWPSGLGTLLAEDSSYLPAEVAHKRNAVLASLQSRFKNA
jgi:hypothetical protein